MSGNNGDNAFTQEVNTPWIRLLRYMTAKFHDPEEAFTFSTGIDFGLAIALRHPEYAAALRQAAQAETASGAPETETLVDNLVNAVPIEAEG